MIDIDDVVGFCFDKLNIRKDVIVHVHLDNLLEEDGVKGWCHDDEVIFEDDKIEYEIELEESLDDNEMFITLCHEMVHVKQYSEGRDADEDEAYELENILFEKYLKEHSVRTL